MKEEKIRMQTVEKLLEFCVENNLVIANTHFKRRSIYNFTRKMTYIKIRYE